MYYRSKQLRYIPDALDVAIGILIVAVVLLVTLVN